MKDNDSLIAITVYKPGTHAGIRYNPGPEGHTLQVSRSAADLLRKTGATEKPTAAVPEVPGAKVAVSARPQG